MSKSVAGAASGEVGSLLRALREGAGLTLDALAGRASCSKAYLSLVENGQRTLSLERAGDIEAALEVHDGRLQAALQWQRVPQAIRAQVRIEQARSATMRQQLREAMDSDDPLASLRALFEPSDSASAADSAQAGHAPAATMNIAVTSSPLAHLARGWDGRGAWEGRGRPIPIINKVAAGYPHEFTDLDYPRAIADDYLGCPDVSDPDAFAARVVGDSMEPEYFEGDVVVFSPAAKIAGMGGEGGMDCFARLERDGQTTFKRVYFEDEGRMIRLQPLNSAYPPTVVPREEVTGLYAAVYVLRKVRAGR